MVLEKSPKCVRRVCVRVLEILPAASPALRIEQHPFEFLHFREGAAEAPPRGCSSRNLTRQSHREFLRAVNQSSLRQEQGTSSRPVKCTRREDPEPAEGVSYRDGEQAFSSPLTHVEPWASFGQGRQIAGRSNGKERWQFTRSEERRVGKE